MPLVLTGAAPFFSSSSSIYAQSIGINFVSNRDTNAVLTLWEYGGYKGSIQTHWNSSNGGTTLSDGANGTEADIISPNPGVLTDSRGHTVPTKVRWSSNGTWNTANGTVTPDSKLMNGYIFAQHPDGFGTVDFTNIPYPTY